MKNFATIWWKIRTAAEKIFSFPKDVLPHPDRTPAFGTGGFPFAAVVAEVLVR